jgi:hypothetical protein
LQFLDLHQKETDEHLGREPLGVTLTIHEILPPNLKFNHGPYNPYLRQAFIQTATDAGTRLGTPPEGTNPSEFWIDRLVDYCRKENDYYLSHVTTGSDNKPHAFTLISLCEASATFCAWLDIEALNDAALGSDGNLHRVVVNAVATVMGDKTIQIEVPESDVGPEGKEKYNAKRFALLQSYRSRTQNPSHRQIYTARNSAINKPEFYEWLKGILPDTSKTTRKFENFLKQNKLPIPKKAKE